MKSVHKVVSQPNIIWQQLFNLADMSHCRAANGPAAGQSSVTVLLRKIAHCQASHAAIATAVSSTADIFHNKRGIERSQKSFYLPTEDWEAIYDLCFASGCTYNDQPNLTGFLRILGTATDHYKKIARELGNYHEFLYAMASAIA